MYKNDLAYLYYTYLCTGLRANHFIINHIKNNIMTIQTKNQNGSTTVTLSLGEVIVGVKLIVLVTLLIKHMTAKK